MRFADAVVHSPALSRAFLDWHCLSGSIEDVRAHPLTAQVFDGLMALMRPSKPGPVLQAGLWAGDLRERLFALAGEGDATVASLNARLDLTRYGSWRRVKNAFGLAPKPLLSHLRLISAKQMLAHGHPVVEAALDCGYHDQSHFSRQFAAAYGFTPAQFRRVQTALG